MIADVLEESENERNIFIIDGDGDENDTDNNNGENDGKCWICARMLSSSSSWLLEIRLRFRLATRR